MWVYLDDQMAFNAKVVRVGNEAIGARDRMMCWSSAHKLDGFVPNEIAAMIASPKLIRRMLDHNVLEPRDGGYYVHDFLVTNPSAAEVAERRARRSEAGILGGKRSGASRVAKQSRSNAEALASTDDEANAKLPGSTLSNPSPSPDPKRERETAQPPAAPTLASEREWGDDGERHAPTQAELIRDAEAPGQDQILIGLLRNADMLEGVPVTALARRMAFTAAKLPADVDLAQLAADCCTYARGWAGKANKKTTAKQRAAAVERKLGWVIAERPAQLARIAAHVNILTTAQRY